ncbi:MAG: hypothetical protein U0457_11990 [Candidatus Sericytochromatia bacterium]
MKKILFILFFLFISSCTAYYSNIEIKEVSKELPKKVFINNNNTGFLLYNTGLYKIKELTITKDFIPFNDNNKNFSLNLVLYDEDIDFYSLIYSRNIDEGKILNFSENFRREDYPYYLIKIPKNSSNIFEIKNIMNKDSNTSNIFKINDNKYAFLSTESLTSYNFNLFINLYNQNSFITKNYLDKNQSIKSSSIKFLEKYQDFKIKTDENGNGFFSFYDRNNFYIFKLENYTKKDELHKEIIDNSIFYNKNIYTSLDYKGNGYILYKKIDINNNDVTIYFDKFEKFKKIDYYDLFSLQNKKLLDIKIDEMGNGYILYNELNFQSKIILNTKIIKIVNFKIENNSEKLILNNKESEINELYDFSINNIGNGLAIFISNSSKNFKLVKIKNYETER